MNTTRQARRRESGWTALYPDTQRSLISCFNSFLATLDNERPVNKPDAAKSTVSVTNSDTLTTVPRLMKDLCYIPTPQTHTHHPYNAPNNRPEMATFHVWHDGWWDKRECYVWYTFGRGRELGGRRIMDPFYPLFPPVMHIAWTVDDGAIKSCRDKQKRMKDKNRAHLFILREL